MKTSPLIGFDDGERSDPAFSKKPSELPRKLDELPQKSRRSRKQVTRRDLIAEWYESLRSAQEKGYTYAELAEIISSEQECSITAGTLRKYMAETKKHLVALEQSSLPPSSAISPLPSFQKGSSNLSPDRQESFTTCKPASNDDIDLALNKEAVSFPMSVIHLIGDNKNDVDESLICRVLIEYCLTRGIEFVLAECDPESLDVVRIYRSPVEKILDYLTEDPTKRSKVDRLFTSAIKKPVLANLPTNVHESLRQWFVEDGIYELGCDCSLSLCNWIVISSGYDSMKFFIKLLRDIGQYIPHFLVKNHGLCSTCVDEDKEVQDLVANYEVQVINFPKFPYAERNFVEANQLTLTAALNHPDLSLVSRQRIKNFMREAFSQIESTGAFTNAEQSQSSERS